MIFVVVAFFLVLLGYPIAMEALWERADAGMAAVAVTTEGRRSGSATPPSAAPRAHRLLAHPGGGGRDIVILLDRDNQRLGDLAAGTLGAPGADARRPHGPGHGLLPAPTGSRPAAGLDVTTVTPEQYEVPGPTCCG